MLTKSWQWSPTVWTLKYVIAEVRQHSTSLDSAPHWHNSLVVMLPTTYIDTPHTMPPHYAVHTTLYTSVAQALRFSQLCYRICKSSGMWHCVTGWPVPNAVKDCNASLSEHYDPSQWYEGLTRHNSFMSQNIRVFWHVTLCQYTSILRCF